MIPLGERVRKVRDAYGFSVDDAAHLGELSAQRWQSIEEGETASTQELGAMADALGVDPAQLRSGTTGGVARSIARFRAPLGLGDLSPRDVRTLARAAEAGRVCGYLWKALGKPKQPIVEAREVRGISALEPWKQGYELGAKARERLLPGSKPIVSLQRWLEERGVHVAVLPFETARFEAASLFEAEACPVILLNKSVDKVRYVPARRAQLAHELCHLLHDGGERDLLTLVSTDLDSDPLEQRAGGFAPSFIAPGKWVRPGAKSAADMVGEIAATWGLSFEGSAWHAKNLKLIPADVAERLASQKKKTVSFETEFEPELPRTPPDMFGIEVEATSLTSGLLAELAIEAHVEGVISKARAAEILCLR